MNIINNLKMYFYLFIFFFLFFSSGVQGATLFVDDDDITCGGNSPCYSQIQLAVNDSNISDTISIMPGTFIENIMIDKSLNLVGSGIDQTYVVASDLNFNTISFYGDNMNISFLTVSGAGDIIANIKRAGIYSESSNYSNISSVKVSNNYYGIYTTTSKTALIANNFAYNNSIGFFTILSNNLKINNNTAWENRYGGIVSFSSNNQLGSNVLRDNGLDGFQLWDSNSNTVNNNTAINNGWAGFSMWYGDSNQITGNSLAYNEYGIFNFWSDQTAIEANIIENNLNFGIYVIQSMDLSISSDNQIDDNLNNFFINIQTATGFDISNDFYFGNITYDQITQDGTTSIDVLYQDELLQIPANTELIGNQFDITTTAPHAGNITVCLDYNDTGIPDESIVKLMNKESGVWTDITDFIDTANNVVCGEVGDTSVFAVLQVPLSPILECVDDNGDGTYSAHFGYWNPNPSPVIIPVGPGNKFTPLPEDRGQPTTFQPGRTAYYPNPEFSLVFNGSPLTWTLNGEIASASNDSAMRCITYYCDFDGDTFYNSNIDGYCIGEGCEPASCQTVPGTDCDDSDSTIYPGAYELCNGLDDNCDTVPDEGVCTITFSDVPPAHWAYPYIDFLFSQGIISGYPDGTFQPGNSITRAQFAKMIVNANGISEYYPPVPTFSDVPLGHWAYGYIEAAVQADIISGYPDGTFRPSDEVTRAQISAMIARSRGWTYSGGLEDFPDVPTDHWAYDSIMAMKGKGILSGFPDGYFYPSNPASRAQNSKMITLMMQTP